MTAGLNARFDVYRMESATDDEVGGAQVTGTLVYSRIPGSLMENSPNQLLLQQGVETVKSFGIVLEKGTANILERDEVELVSPYNHEYLNDRFRLVGIQYQSFHPSDRRKYLVCSATRSEVAHANQ